MYLSYYNLRFKPFPEITEPARLWLSKKTKEGLALFRDGVMRNRGIMLLTGDVGTGKTSFINILVPSLPENIVVGNVVNPGLHPQGFLHVVADIFRLPGDAAALEELLSSFKQFLIGVAAEGKRVLLVIDEAQQLNNALLQLILSLANLNDKGSNLLNIILVGQNEIKMFLSKPENSDIRQKIAVTHNIVPLTKAETAQYIQHHLRLAGGSVDIFSPEAIDAVFTITGGSPRLINLLCDLALLSGFTSESPVISKEIVSDCRKKLMLPQARIIKQHPAVAPETAKPDAQLTAKTRKTNWRKQSFGLLFIFVIILFGARQLMNRMASEDNTEKPSTIPPYNQTITTPEAANPAPAQTVSKVDEPQPSGPVAEQSILHQTISEVPSVTTANHERAVKNASEIKIAAVEDTTRNIHEQPRQTVEPAAKQIVASPAAAEVKIASSSAPKKSPRADKAILITVIAPAKEDNEKRAIKNSSNSQMITQAKPLPEKTKIPLEIHTDPDLRNGAKKVLTVYFGNLRDGPSTDANIIGVAKQGDTVFDLVKKQSWYFVKLEDGRLGWMHESLFAPIQKIDIEKVEEPVSHSTPAQPAPTKPVNPPRTVVERRVTVHPAVVKKAQPNKDEAPVPLVTETEPAQRPPLPESSITQTVRLVQDPPAIPAIPPVAEIKSLVKTGNPKALEWTQKSFESVSHGRFKQAINEATQAIDLDPGLVNPYINRAWAYCETGLYEKAIADCQTALTIEPGNALAINNFGLVYHRMGKLIIARDYYKKACNLKLDVACGNYRLLASTQ